MVLKFSHLVAPGCFGSVTKTDLHMASGNNPSSYILLANIFTHLVPNLSEALSISMTIPSGPAAFPFFMFARALTTSSSRIGFPYLFVIVGFCLWSSAKRSLMYYFHLCSISSSSISIVTFLASMQLGAALFS